MAVVVMAVEVMAVEVVAVVVMAEWTIAGSAYAKGVPPRSLQYLVLMSCLLILYGGTL